MKPYRIKHVPSGLYFQPINISGSHLGKNGKIYSTAVNPFNRGIEDNGKHYSIELKLDSKVFKIISEMNYKHYRRYGNYTEVFEIPVEEFEKEYIQSVESETYVWIARDDIEYDEYNEPIHVRGDLHIFYDTPVYENGKWSNARVIGTPESYMYPDIKEGTCEKFTLTK